MRQHPIPQNILDIEFKLFTKFTVREFVYMAIGVIFGGIFLYFYAEGDLPGIIAFPIFLISSALGLFFGLVPINDQKADVYVKNYISAITNPTQRVWKSKELDTKLSREELEITRGNMNRSQGENGKVQIIGSGPESIQKEAGQDAAEVLDQDEEERLKKIEQAAVVTGSATPNPASPNIQQPVVNQPTTQSQKSPTATASIQQNQTQKVTIAKNNLVQFDSPELNKVNTNGTVNMYLVSGSGQPVSGAIATIKDSAGRVVGAYRSNEQGVVLTDRKLNPGTYYVNIKAQQNEFSPLELLVEGDEIMKLKITAQNIGR